MTVNFWGPFSSQVYLYFRAFFLKIISFTVITSKTAKYRYLFHSRLFTFHSLVQLLLPVVRLNEVRQSISIKYKMVHALNQAVFGTENFENLAILDFSSIQLCFRTGLRCHTE